MIRKDCIDYDRHVSSSRRYHSDLRQERADDTRLRIRRAARTLFSTQGFAATTIAEVAKSAGVAPQTVYSVFGSKRGIVAAMLDDIEETSGQEDWVARIRSAHDPRAQLRLFVAWLHVFYDSSAPVLRAALVARDDPDVGSLVAQGDTNRRNGTAELVAQWSEQRVLRAEVDRTRAAETMWLITGPEQFFRARDFLTWSGVEYEAWLYDVLETLMFGPEAST